MAVQYKGRDASGQPLVQADPRRGPHLGKMSADTPFAPARGMRYQGRSGGRFGAPEAVIGSRVINACHT